MNQWAFFDELKAGTVRNVYLFYGPEDFIRRSALATLQKRTLAAGLESMNCTVLSAPTAQQIIESCETLPMMSDYRMVVVRDCALLAAGKAKDEAQEAAALGDYLPHVPDTTCLVFDAGTALDKRKKLSQALVKLPGAVSFDTLDDASLQRWMNQQLRALGKCMDRAACEALAFQSGRDLTLLSGELAKLAAYSGEREEITAADVEAVATRTAESTVFAMADALAVGKASEAFGLLGSLLAAGESRIGILAMITRHYRQLMYACALRDARAPQAQMARELGAPAFAVGRLLRQAGKRTVEQLRACVEQCVQTDFDIKSGAVREDAALFRLMMRLLEQK